MTSRSVNDFKSLELKGITPLNEELGRGAYGKVFVVKYCEMTCAAREIHSILVEGVGEAEMHQTIQSFLTVSSMQRITSSQHCTIPRYLLSFSCERC